MPSMGKIVKPIYPYKGTCADLALSGINNEDYNGKKEQVTSPKQGNSPFLDLVDDFCH